MNTAKSFLGLKAYLAFIVLVILISCGKENPFDFGISLDEVRYNWLISELDKLQTNPGYPNLIMWISGHVHRNVITVLAPPDPNHPELGFWQVETSSLKDFPQQFRTFEIDRNSDNTISIFTTNVDPAIKDGSFAAIARSYAIADREIILPTPVNQLYLPPSGSYNAELVKQLSPEMQVKIQNYGTPIDK